MLLAGCPGKTHQRTYPTPSSTDLLTKVRDARARIKTLNAETLSDVRVGKDRANLTVFILAAWGGKLRFLALNPNESRAAELASDGTQYCFEDAHANCGGCGPATAENVARLVRIILPPDEIVALLVGSAPVVEHTSATVSWDAERGAELLELTGTDGTRERIWLDGRGRTWDVIRAEATTPKGKLLWRIQHKDFREVKGADGTIVRMPGKSYFEQEGDNVLIRWKEQRVNEPLGDEKFELEVTPGLPACR